MALIFLKKILPGIGAFLTACALQAAPGQSTLSLGAIGAAAWSPIPLSASKGIGAVAAYEVRLSDLLALGLSGGLAEFIATPDSSAGPPTLYQRQDMKTIWLDLSGRFFPFPASPAGEAYFQLGFGVSPHFHLDLSGSQDTFNDYWPNYTYEIYRGYQFYPNDPGTINWDAQTSVGYQFNLGDGRGLDLGLQYDYFWPPADRPLQTLGFKAAMVFFMGGPKTQDH